LHERIILFDTEYTAWEGSQARRWSEPWEHREIIQIAALQVDLNQDVAEVSHFNRLIRPERNPLLSDYIINLTGISQKTVDANGGRFSDAFEAFYEFCEGGKLPLYSWGDDPGVLRENCVLSDIPFREFPAGFHDIRDPFEAAGIDTHGYTSGTVHQAVGASFDQAAHNALNDVRSLAVTIRKLRREGKWQ